MPNFPTKQTEMLALIRQMLAGYQAHTSDFPSVNFFTLGWEYGLYMAVRNNQIKALTAAKLATKAKNDKLQILKDIMKSYLRKSEVDVADNPEKLALIGWGPPKMPQSIERPGQPNNLRSTNQGQGNLTLKWNKPTCGGAVRNYIIQRRYQRKADGKFSPWELIATTYQNQIILTNQPQKSTLEYRVKAVNISGESVSSNTITVVL